jgi:hypothetical protein
MTSLQKELGTAPPLAEVAERAAQYFAEDFGMKLESAKCEAVGTA